MELQDGCFQLSKPELKALVAFSSTDEARLPLYGIAFDAGRGRAAATDGHRMVLVQARGDVVASAAPVGLVPLDACKQALAACTKGCHVSIRMPGTPLSSTAGDGAPALGMPTVDLATVEVRGELGDVKSVAHVKLSSVAPPPYDQIVPRLDGAVAPRTPFVTVNAAYLADMQLIGRATEPRGCGVELWLPAEPLDPVVFKAESSADGAEWTAVLMPVRNAREAEAPSASVAVDYAARAIARETKRDEATVRAALRRVAAPTSKGARLQAVEG